VERKKTNFNDIIIVKTMRGPHLNDKDIKKEIGIDFLKGKITKLVEENKTLLRLGLCFDVPDARVRITEHLQKNNDRIRLRRIGCEP